MAPGWHATAKALSADGLPQRAIALRLGVTQGAVNKALNPEKRRAADARQNSRPERKAAKRTWNRKKAAEKAARYKDVDPEIPGLLPLWNAWRIVDFVRVDLDDWETLRGCRFGRSAKHYATTQIDGKRVYIHHLLLGHFERGPGFQVDHINRDPLDNRRANLRVVTSKENQHNRGGIHERCWWRQMAA